MNSISATLTVLRAVLSSRVGRLREAIEEGDKGASAVELAIITAVILGIAVTLLAVISKFVSKQSNSING
jgi:hypothetical protein